MQKLLIKINRISKAIILKNPYLLIFLTCFATLACSSKNDIRKEEKVSNVKEVVNDSEKRKKSSESANMDDEDFEDEMEFMPPIENNSYLGIVVGNAISDYQDLLKPGTLKTGEGEFEVQYIIYMADTLGYAFGEETIESIHIWDSRGATNQGIRVGTTFGELKKILENPEVHGSEIESRVYAIEKNRKYRLNYFSMEYDLDISKIPDTISITEIIITK